MVGCACPRVAASCTGATAAVDALNVPVPPDNGDAGSGPQPGRTANAAPSTRWRCPVPGCPKTGGEPSGPVENI